jgi:hypothetical protein
VALVGSLRRAFRILAPSAAAVAFSCSTRDVYLVPSGSPKDASVVRGPDGTFVRPPDAHVPDVGPPPFPTGRRDAGDSGPRCETDRYTQVTDPLGVYLMVDQSASMESRWKDVVTALGDFITDSGLLTDVSMGIQYFAVSPTSPTQPFPDWQNQACSALTYETPDVAIDPLPGNKDAILGSLTQHDPGNPASRPPVLPLGIRSSPTDVALTGAIAGIRAWSEGKKNPKLAILLVTDRIPGIECIRPVLDGAIQAARDGVQGTPSVVTYVLGVRDQLDPLNQVASAGGTDHAYLVGTTAASGDILAQLDSIREVALPCEISVDKQHLDQRDVNVELRTADTRTVLSQVPTKANCTPSPTAMQWYAAEADAAKNVALCPPACTSIRATKNATLDVVYGCPTMVFTK